MREKKIWFHPVLLIGLLMAISPIYEILNESTKGAVDVTTSFDAFIPFVPEFVVPYVLWYPFIYVALIYYCFVDRKKYYIALSSLIIGKLVSFTVYAIWQSTVPRPTVVGNDVFSQLVQYIYSVDQPVNCLPSIHVMTTAIIMIVALQRLHHKWEATIVNVLGTLIILSTMFTKQHAILDVLAGLLLACGVYALSQFAFSMVKVWQTRTYKVRELSKTKYY